MQMDNTGYHEKKTPERICVIDVDGGTEGDFKDFVSYENKPPRQPFRSYISHKPSSTRGQRLFLKHHLHSQPQSSQMPQNLFYEERNNPNLFTNSSSNPQKYFPVSHQNFHTRQTTLNEYGFPPSLERHINEPFDRYSIHRNINSLEVQHSVMNERNQPQMEQFHRSTQIPKYQKGFVPTRYCHSCHHRIPLILNKIPQQKISEQISQNDLIQSREHNPTHSHQQVTTLTPYSKEQIKISSNQQQKSYSPYQPISYTTPFSNLQQNRMTTDYSSKQKQTDSIDLASADSSELPPIDNNEYHSMNSLPLGGNHKIIQHHSILKTSPTQINTSIHKKSETQKKEEQNTIKTPLEKIINKKENKEQKKSNQRKSIPSLKEKSKQQPEQLLRNSNSTITQLKTQQNDNDKSFIVKSDIINSERNELKKPRDTIVDKEEKQPVSKKIIPIKQQIINNEISVGGIQKEEKHDKIDNKLNKTEKVLEECNDEKNYLVTSSTENISNYFNFNIEEEGAIDSTEETETFETKCTIEEDDCFDEKYESSYNELMKLLKKIHPIIKEKEARKFAEMIVSYLLRFGNDINSWNSGNEFNIFDKTSLQENVINSFIKEKTLQVNIYTNVILYRRIIRSVKNIKINNFIIPIELQEFYLKSEWKFADDLRLMIQIAKYGVGVYELYLNDSLLNYSLTMKMHLSL
ncbi:hypothetical protein ENUP19_0327G0021 [Entamoeba nuttalli]